MITARQHAKTYQPSAGSPCWHTIADVVAATGVSESAIRRAIRRDCRVTRVSGRYVAGMIEIAAGGRTGYLPYAE